MEDISGTHNTVIGKILLFNEKDGKGLIINSQREKILFSIEDWDDFDVMPSLGLEISFTFKDAKASNILSKSSKDKEIQTTETVQENPKETVHVQTKDTLASPTIKEDVEPIEILSNSTPTQSKTEAVTQENPHESFETEYTQDVIHDIESEIGQKPSSISTSTSIETAVMKYFSPIKEHIERRVGYKKIKGRLDYLVAKRFVWTIYNNLTEMDSNMLTSKIKSLSDDLRIMGSIYEDFITKVKYPPIAFEEIFLSCQFEYKKTKEDTEKVKNKLSFLKNNEKLIGEMLRVKKQELIEGQHTPEFETLNQEFKSLNGAYADIVHMMAELDERHKDTLILLYNFEEAYRKKFYEIFHEKSLQYKQDLVEILNAQAYIVDAQLWQEAKTSKPINAYFKKSSINGELNTKTYLKYYLDSLGSGKDTGENKKLCELYEYLLNTQKEYALIVAESAQNALEHESVINGLGKHYNAKSFIDEKTAIKWAATNSVKVLILEDVLQKTSAETFLNVYHARIPNKPKIILLGSKPKNVSNDYSIHMLFSKNISSKVLADNVKAIFDN